MHTIRPYTPDDYPALAAIRTAAWPFDPVTAAEVQGWDRVMQEEKGHQFHRLVALDAAGQVIGYALARHTDQMPPGQWSVSVVVTPAARHQGAGSLLYQAILEWLQPYRPRVLQSSCRATDQESYGWAQHRGFAQWREGTESVLELNQWDPGRFATHLEQVRATGIRFESFLGVGAGASNQLLRSIHEVEAESAPDIPSFEGTFPEYPIWERWFREDPSTWFLAVALDQGQAVGISYLKLPRPPFRQAYTGYTGVRRA